MSRNNESLKQGFKRATRDAFRDFSNN